MKQHSKDMDRIQLLSRKNWGIDGFFMLALKFSDTVFRTVHFVEQKYFTNLCVISFYSFYLWMFIKNSLFIFGLLSMSCLLCKTSIKRPMEIAATSIFHHQRHVELNSGPSGPKLNALATRPRIYFLNSYNSGRNIVQFIHNIVVISFFFLLYFCFWHLVVFWLQFW